MRGNACTAVSKGHSCNITSRRQDEEKSENHERLPDKLQLILYMLIIWHCYTLSLLHYFARRGCLFTSMTIIIAT